MNKFWLALGFQCVGCCLAIRDDRMFAVHMTHAHAKLSSWSAVAAFSLRNIVCIDKVRESAQVLHLAV